MMRHLMLVLLLSVSPMFTSEVHAAPPVNASRVRNVAIEGFDAVAYFSGTPTEGSSAHTAEWRGALWRFATAENRDLFQADPERYAPQYGGYCAWAMAQGYTADIDPQAWSIVDGRLYLNYSPAVQTKWEADIPGHIAAGDENYRGLGG